jgi:hypothetical protein
MAERLLGAEVDKAHWALDAGPGGRSAGAGESWENGGSTAHVEAARRGNGERLGPRYER